MAILNVFKKNKSSFNNEFNIQKVILSYLVGAIIISFLIWSYLENNKTNNLLNKDGQVTKGVIIEVKKRLRGTDFKYKFDTKHTTITSWGNTYKFIDLGDTIPILFYPKNPHHNKAIIEDY